MKQGKKMIAAKITVPIGYDFLSIVLIPRNWAKVKNGKSLSIRGKGYYYEGEHFWDYWNFSGGLQNELRVSYGDGGAVGYTGSLADADVSEFEYS
ncbi:hypothetical protein N9100_00945 [Gammaproteobacteria bacterium]|nr:hypothetical protein [Gammaproteobacteria bacterium]